jgi:hypothetical protein
MVVVRPQQPLVVIAIANTVADPVENCRARHSLLHVGIAIVMR